MMQAALRLDTCSCTQPAKHHCSACGAPLCRGCSHMEVTGLDPDAVAKAYYCPACSENPSRNAWGTLYWERLRALFN